MPREFARARRVEEQLRRDLADLIRAEDQAPGPEPGPGMVSITAARVSADLSQAKIYVSVLPDDKDIVERSMAALQRCSGKLRHLLARRMRIRAVPRLRFVYDDLTRKGAALDDIIGRAVAEDRRRAETPAAAAAKNTGDGGHG